MPTSPATHAEVLTTGTVKGRPQELSSSSDALQTPAAYPAVQPLKAALYFDSAAGFGPWGIWIGQRACKNLRAMRKKDPKTFTLIQEKLKCVRVLSHARIVLIVVCRELSYGQFSGDNLKRLTGIETVVPIFEAKIAKDTRLVVSYYTLA